VGLGEEVWHTMALPFTLKSMARPCERRIMETQIFHHRKLSSSKNPLKKTKILLKITKILQDMITL
jgi:hypothetical protein